MVQISRFPSAIKLTRQLENLTYCVLFMRKIRSNFKFMMVVRSSLMTGQKNNPIYNIFLMMSIVQISTEMFGTLFYLQSKLLTGNNHGRHFIKFLDRSFPEKKTHFLTFLVVYNIQGFQPAVIINSNLILHLEIIYY